jgi:hypothetical protein
MAAVRQNTSSVMNTRLLDFLQRKVNTFVKWDLIRFFNDNPHTADTAENIARYIGRETREVVSELLGLAENGLLTTRTAGGVRIFRLVDDKDTRQIVNEFVSACGSREFRMEAIQVINELRR